MQFLGAMMGLVVIGAVLTSPLWVSALVVWAVVAGRRRAGQARSVMPVYQLPAPPPVTHVHLHHQSVYVQMVRQERVVSRDPLLSTYPVVVDGAISDPSATDAPHALMPTRPSAFYRPAGPGQLR